MYKKITPRLEVSDEAMLDMNQHSKIEKASVIGLGDSLKFEVLPNS